MWWKTRGIPRNGTCPAIPTRTKTAMWRIPRVNPSEDMVDLMSASRGYQANVSAMTAIKDMILHSIDLMK